MVEIQADEYGDGATLAMHAELFADTLRAVELDPTYGAYLDPDPGRHPRHDQPDLPVRPASPLARRPGHLALFEMTSVGPMGRYADALERLGVGPEGRAFYEVHVEADEEHQHIALERMVRGPPARSPSSL